ncbi:hypothetical protein HOLleu_37817 [Holothuria leucospilota]|uniref:Uncharacterized protein n=1 Tax=Holothuria leucospilota TaxID=206669 RepID=A0A9Q1BFL1_HOLLE|nr:hypothetical protein HOLleu_37817 [Holothuria leucospilota]
MANIIPNSQPLVKNLFGSPSSVDEGDKIDSLCDQLQVEENTQLAVRNAQKEIHEKRLEELRKQQEYLKETNWKYKPADSLIGL